MMTLEEIWPLFALRIRCGPLELAPVRDDDIAALVDLAQGGIHDPAVMPFMFPWTDARGDELARNMALHYWHSRGALTPQRWGVAFVVRREGVVVGIQAVGTHDYPVTKTGETGSWLGLEHQGRGTGTLMRQVLCAFLFDHLDAEEITSGAFLDNPASMAVSMKAGYRANGVTRECRRGSELAALRHLVLQPSDLVRPPDPLEVEGLDAVRRLLGLD